MPILYLIFYSWLSEKTLFVIEGIKANDIYVYNTIYSSHEKGKNQLQYSNCTKNGVYGLKRDLMQRVLISLDSNKLP